MGVLTKHLPDMRAVVFDGHQPDPELTALGKMEAWLTEHPEVADEHRIFGHNIDADGKLSHEPENEGYRVLLTVPESAVPFADGTEVQSIPGGEFVVTGIEGSFDEDPTGSWITEGWARLNEMVKRNELDPDPSYRWFEEQLEPVKAGNTRFDLYLELRPSDPGWLGSAV